MRVPIEEQIKAIAKIKKKVNIEQNGTVLFITISGSDLYGFPSEDSDVDYRGVYVTGVHNLLGLRTAKDVIDFEDEDIVMHEIGKELSLAIAGNCNAIERINATPIYRTPDYVQLKQLVNNAFGKRGLYGSYHGLAMFNYEKFIKRGKKTYKKYLYIFRGLLAGIHVLETGRIQPSLVELNKYFKIKELDVLIKHKIESTEEAEVKDLNESGRFDELILPLCDRMDRAYLRSKLPEEPDEEDVQRINSWLIDLRLREVR